MINRRYLSVIDWQQVHNDVYKLAVMVMGSGFSPDIIIGIGFGGIIPSTLFYFVHPEVKFRIVYPKSSSNGIIEPISGIEGKKVLLMDDLAITGDSLMGIKEKIRGQGAKEVRSACLYQSEDYNGLDFFIRKLEQGELIVFPWYAFKEENQWKIFEYRNRFGKHEPME